MQFLWFIAGMNLIGLIFIYWLANQNSCFAAFVVPALDELLNEYLDIPKWLKITLEVLFVIIFLPALIVYAISIIILIIIVIINISFR